MGDPKKPKKRLSPPRHPWQATRIKEEKELVKKYGLTNKKEIQRAAYLLKKWRIIAKNVIALPEGEQKVQEEHKLLAKLQKVGLLEKEASIDDVLALEIPAILNKRLQTVAFRMGLANTVKQARQFVLHGKISVNGKSTTAPSYLVEANDKISFIEGFAPQVIVKKMIEEGKKIKAETDLRKAKEELANDFEEQAEVAK